MKNMRGRRRQMTEERDRRPAGEDSRADRAVREAARQVLPQAFFRDPERFVYNAARHPEILDEALEMLNGSVYSEEENAGNTHRKKVSGSVACQSMKVAHDVPGAGNVVLLEVTWPDRGRKNSFVRSYCVINSPDAKRRSFRVFTEETADGRHFLMEEMPDGGRIRIPGALSGSETEAADAVTELYLGSLRVQ